MFIWKFISFRYKFTFCFSLFQVLAEDRSRNRLVESLDLFEGIVSLPWFREVPIILFLNKQDIFAQKIMEVDIAVYFNNFTGCMQRVVLFNVVVFWINFDFVRVSFIQPNTTTKRVWLSSRNHTSNATLILQRQFTAISQMPPTLKTLHSCGRRQNTLFWSKICHTLDYSWYSYVALNRGNLWTRTLCTRGVFYWHNCAHVCL